MSDKEYYQITIKGSYDDGVFKTCYNGNDDVVSFVGLLVSTNIAKEKGVELKQVLDLVKDIYKGKPDTSCKNCRHIKPRDGHKTVAGGFICGADNTERKFPTLKNQCEKWEKKL